MNNSLEAERRLSRGSSRLARATFALLACHWLPLELHLQPLECSHTQSAANSRAEIALYWLS